MGQVQVTVTGLNVSAQLKSVVKSVGQHLDTDTQFARELKRGQPPQRIHLHSILHCTSLLCP